MKYYIRKNDKPENRAELRLAVNAGSTSEDEDQKGLAHLTEHMAFNGSANFKRNELVDYLESVGTKFGPHLNAYTSFDETVYMIQIPTDDSTIVNTGLKILKDWSHYLSFDSLEIEKERGVVVEEWRLGQGANERMRRQYWPLIFKDARYAERIPIGSREIIEHSPQSVIKRFYEDWYRPDLMAIVVVGDIDPKVIEAKLKEDFSSIQSSKSPRPLVSYPVPDNEDIIVATAKDKEARISIVEIIYKQPKEEEKTIGDYRRSMAQNLFSGMMDARMVELARDADPPFINSSSDYGRFVRTVNAYTSFCITKEDGIERALVTLATENERVRRFGFTQGELERQKMNYMRRIETAYLERDKTESRNLAREYVSNFLTGEPFPGIEYEYQLAKKYLAGISLKEVNAFAAKWITDGRNCIVLITAPDKETTSIPGDEKIKQVIHNMKSLDLKPYDDKVSSSPLMADIPKPGKVVSEERNEELDITQWILQNGIRVFIKKTDFKNDEILFTSYSWGGWSVYPENDFHSAEWADEIVDESGISEFSAIDLMKKLSGKIIGCSPYINELMQGISGSCTPADLETTMQLINLYYTKPRKDNEAFSSWMEKKKGILKNRNVDPSSVFSDTIAYVMSGYNYHFKPTTLETLGEISLDRAYEIYKERFRDVNGTNYFFVGNFNLDSLKHYVQIYLGSLPTLGGEYKWADTGARPPEGKIERIVLMGQEPRSTVMLRWNMPFEYNRHNRNELMALNKLMSIRLREVLREEKSGVYGVSINSVPQHYPYQKLEQIIYFSCSPDNVDTLINAAIEIIKEVKQNGCDEKNLVKIKETAIRERETYLKDNHFWLNTMSSNNQNGEDLRDILKYNEWIKKLKGSDFKAFAEKYLQENNYAKFILMPATNPKQN